MNDLTVIDRYGAATRRWEQVYESASFVATRLSSQGICDGSLVLLPPAPSIKSIGIMLGAWAAGSAVGVAPPGGADRVVRVFGRADHLFRVVEVDARSGPWETVSSEELTVKAPSTPLSPDSFLANAPAQVAIVQATSGTTGDRRLVGITWAMLRHQLDVLSTTLEISADNGSHLASWLPLYHDMGLITFGVLPALRGVTCSVLSTDLFRLEPRRWSDLLLKENVTMTAMPNAGFGATARIFSGLQGAGLETLRDVFCSSELISRQVIERFVDSGLPLGLRSPSVGFAYGMAEATLAVSLKRRALSTQPWHRVIAGEEELWFARCGQPVSGTQIKAEQAPDSMRFGASRIAVSGPGVINSYLGGSPGDGWHRTGDCGIVSDGEIVPLWRESESLKVNGVSIPPSEVEAVVSQLPGVVQGGLAAVSLHTPRGEVPAVVIEFDSDSSGGLNDRAVKQIVRQALGITLAKVLIVRRGEIPRTTSGKIQRLGCRRMFDSKLPVL